jgi:hypothetical protein
MFRQSLIAGAVAVVAVTSAATAGLAQTETGAPHRTIVHQTWPPIPDYGPLNVPYYATHFGPAAPVAAAAGVAGATACFALSLVGAC